MINLLFVCLGNICRSPAAEAIMTRIIQEESQSKGSNLMINLDSAGTSSFHCGQLPDARMRQALSSLGYTHFSRSRPVETSDFVDFDLILAMDRSNFENLRQLCPNPKFLTKIKMMCSYCTQFDTEQVPDPYYGGEDGFKHVIHLLEDACRGLWVEIKDSVV